MKIVRFRHSIISILALVARVLALKLATVSAVSLPDLQN